MARLRLLGQSSFQVGRLAPFRPALAAKETCLCRSGARTPLFRAIRMTAKGRSRRPPSTDARGEERTDTTIRLPQPDNRAAVQVSGGAYADRTATPDRLGCRTSAKTGRPMGIRTAARDRHLKKLRLQIVRGPACPMGAQGSGHSRARRRVCRADRAPPGPPGRLRNAHRHRRRCRHSRY